MTVTEAVLVHFASGSDQVKHMQKLIRKVLRGMCLAVRFVGGSIIAHALSDYESSAKGTICTEMTNSNLVLVCTETNTKHVARPLRRWICILHSDEKARQQNVDGAWAMCTCSTHPNTNSAPCLHELNCQAHHLHQNEAGSQQHHSFWYAWRGSHQS